VRFRDALYWSIRRVASYVVKEPGYREDMDEEDKFCLSSRLNVTLDAFGRPTICNANHYAADMVPELIKNSDEWEPFPEARDAISELGRLASGVEPGCELPRGPEDRGQGD